MRINVIKLCALKTHCDGVFMCGLPGGALSTVSSGHVIDFEKAELRRLPFQEGVYLWVRGRMPAAGMEALLAPQVYHGRPDYWGIEVAAFASIAPANDTGRIGADSKGEAGDDLVFERSVPLSGITGTRGVTVIGANRSEQIDIDGEAF
jgi:hypothetical protein